MVFHSPQVSQRPAHFGGDRAAGLADEAGGGLGHQGLIRLFRPGAPSYNRRMDMSNSARRDTGRPASGPDTYNRDFYAWAMEQAALMRAGRLAEADIQNIAEEIESMGRGEKRELVSRLTVLLTHLLKWRAQPGLRGRSWHLTMLSNSADISPSI